MRKNIQRCFLFCFVLACAGHASAQLADSSGLEGNSKLPVIIISKGVLNFVGDVGYSHLNEPLLHQGGFQLSAQFSVKSRLSPSVYYLNGTISANEKSIARTLNFKTTFNAIGAQVNYQFLCKDKPRKILVPFLSAGIEYLSFVPKGDLKSAEGATYYYWNDGTIRSVDESAPNASTAQIINRDYNYETNLRDANLDGIGNYSLSTFAVPVGIGVKMNLSGRCAFYLSTVAHFTFTDNLDNISSSGTGARQGDSKNDKFVYSSAALSYDLGAPRDTPKKKKYKNKDFKHIDFNALAKEDQDKDGVPDIDDESPDTPPNTSVDSKGRPLDADEDGVPDYRDKEMNSAKGALVTEDGRTLTDQLIQEKYIQDSIAAVPEVKEYVRRIGGVGATEKGVPEKFKKVDIDKNGIISDKEIGDAIDEFLAGKSTYSTEEFYSLIDFFFSQ